LHWLHEAPAKGSGQTSHAAPIHWFAHWHEQLGWKPLTLVAWPLQLPALVQAGAQMGNGPKPLRQRSQSVPALSPGAHVAHAAPDHWLRHWHAQLPGSPDTATAWFEQSATTSHTRVSQRAPA
jgi:hypothetical protein